MLFRREVGERIKHVGVIKCPTARSPCLHGLGYHIGYRGIKLAAAGDRALERLEHGLGQGRFHRCQAEDIAGPQLFEPQWSFAVDGRAIENGLDGLKALAGGHGCKEGLVFT